MLFREGEQIVGKWYGERITLQRLIGSGMHGTVYLAIWRGQDVAVKIGTGVAIISSEINRLSQLNRLADKFPGPKLYGCDDMEKKGTIFPFYIMSHQRGKPLNDCGAKGQWLWIVLQLLDHLHYLHEKGYAFGDWKPEHIVVDPVDNGIRFVDVGGLTSFGQDVRQWTELYDRGSWQAGLRVAEPAYDLFAVTLIIMTELFHIPLKAMSRGQRHVSFLCDIIQKHEMIPSAYRRPLLRAVRGEFSSARVYAEAIAEAAGSRGVRSRPNKWLWESCFIVAAVFFLSLLYAMGWG